MSKKEKLEIIRAQADYAKEHFNAMCQTESFLITKLNVNLALSIGLSTLILWLTANHFQPWIIAIFGIIVSLGYTYKAYQITDSKLPISPRKIIEEKKFNKSLESTLREIRDQYTVCSETQLDRIKKVSNNLLTARTYIGVTLTVMLAISIVYIVIYGGTI